MGFSLKRAKAVASGKVVFCIYDSEGELFDTCPNFIIAAQRLDYFENIFPMKKFTIKVELPKE